MCLNKGKRGRADRALVIRDRLYEYAMAVGYIRATKRFRFSRIFVNGCRCCCYFLQHRRVHFDLHRIVGQRSPHVCACAHLCANKRNDTSMRESKSRRCTSLEMITDFVKEWNCEQGLSGRDTGVQDTGDGIKGLESDGIVKIAAIASCIGQRKKAHLHK